MKNISKFIMLVLIGAFILSACQVQTVTPPATPTATATEAVTTSPTTAIPANGTPGSTPSEALTPSPTPDTRLFDENNKMICTPYEPLFPELTADQIAQLAVFPDVSAADWSEGPENATLTIIEYSDFQCPACAAFYTELKTLMAKYPDDVRLVFRNFPLVSLHSNATLAAQAAEAAGRQGKFWDMYNDLFSKQSDWSAMTTADFTNWLKAEAQTLGLDTAKFATDLTSEAVVSKVKSDIDYGTQIGLNSTPTILLNGRPWQYDWSASTLGMVIDVIKAEKDLKMECPPFVIDQNKTYTAVIKTEKGDMVFELYPKEAPLAVNSFVYLSRSGFYDGVTFHRVFHDFVAQAGDPSGTGISGGGYEYREEISPNLSFDQPYMLGVAKSNDPDTSGSQFFITYVAAPELDGKYTVFGKLTSGVDVLNQITERDAQTNPDALAGDKIVSITITEK